MIFEVSNEKELKKVTKEVISVFGKGFYVFTGEMGAGKTTFIRYLLENLGVTDFEGSPTYAIVQQYHLKESIYHLDCYRLENQAEAFEIGLEELFCESAYFFVEWPEKIESFLPTNIIWVYIRKEDETEKRIIHIAYDNQS